MGFPVSILPMRGMAIAAALAIIPALGGCAQIRTHQGYVIDRSLVNSVQPGVDNKQSVSQTLGRPTFMGQFEDDDWYYVSRNMRQLAFGSPRPVTQDVLRVHFDAAGNVQKVDQTGVELVSKINPDGDKTPTRGRERGFFEDLFGNIGTVGAPGVGGAPGGGAPGQ